MESWTKQMHETITRYLWNSCTSGCWRSSWSCKTPTHPALPGGSSSALTWWCWKSAADVPIALAFPVGRDTLLTHSRPDVHKTYAHCNSSTLAFGVTQYYEGNREKRGQKRRGNKKKKKEVMSVCLPSHCLCYKSRLGMQMSLCSWVSGWLPGPLQSKIQKPEKRIRNHCC